MGKRLKAGQAIVLARYKDGKPVWPEYDSERKIMELLHDQIKQKYSKEAWEKAVSGTLTATKKTCGEELWELWEKMPTIAPDAPYSLLKYFLELQEVFQKSVLSAIMSSI